MSAELEGCACDSYFFGSSLERITVSIFMIDLCKICVTDFREDGIFIPPPPPHP